MKESRPCAGAFCQSASGGYDEEKTVRQGNQPDRAEGAIQIFQEYNTGMEEIIVGVVGVASLMCSNTAWKMNTRWRSVWKICRMSPLD